MSTDIARRASLNGGSRSGAVQLPKPTISESAARQDKLDNDQFEKQAADYMAPTLARPALIVAEEVDKIRAEYGTGSGRLNVLVKVTGKRLDYWTEQSGGGTPFDPISESDRARCQAFFEKYGVRLAGQPRQAPPNPLRREPAPTATPAAAPAVAEPKPPAPAAAAADPAAVPGVAKGVSPLPLASLDMQFINAQGFQCSLHLQAPSWSSLLETAGKAATQLAQSGAKPVKPAPAAPAAAPSAQAAGEEAPKCKYHGTTMKPSKKPGEFFCPSKIKGTDDYCDYKVTV